MKKSPQEENGADRTVQEKVQRRAVEGIDHFYWEALQGRVSLETRKIMKFRTDNYARYPSDDAKILQFATQLLADCPEDVSEDPLRGHVMQLIHRTRRMLCATSNRLPKNPQPLLMPRLVVRGGDFCDIDSIVRACGNPYAPDKTCLSPLSNITRETLVSALKCKKKQQIVFHKFYDEPSPEHIEKAREILKENGTMIRDDEEESRLIQSMVTGEPVGYTILHTDPHNSKTMHLRGLGVESSRRRNRYGEQIMLHLSSFISAPPPESTIIAPLHKDDYVARTFLEVMGFKPHESEDEESTHGPMINPWIGANKNDSVLLRYNISANYLPPKPLRERDWLHHAKVLQNA